jgi:hypothetical protein
MERAPDVAMPLEGVDILHTHRPVAKQLHAVLETARGSGNAPPSPRGPHSYEHGASSAATNDSSLSGAASGSGSFASQTGPPNARGSPERRKSAAEAGDAQSFVRPSEVWEETTFACAAEDERLGVAAPRQPSIDELLRDSVLSFHRDGPLVNPMETHASAGSGSGGWLMPSAAVASTRDQMRFVADAKGFDYGIFWRLRGAETFEYDVGLDARRDDGSDGMMSLFIQTSASMYPSWVMGFGMAGRVGFTGNYEWHEEISALPAWSFQRLRQAANAGIRTIVSVPTADGVVEFGSTVVMPHNVSTVQYIQKLRGAPSGAPRGAPSR